MSKKIKICAIISLKIDIFIYQIVKKQEVVDVYAIRSNKKHLTDFIVRKFLFIKKRGKIIKII